MFPTVWPQSLAVIGRAVLLLRTDMGFMLIVYLGIRMLLLVPLASECSLDRRPIGV